VPTKKLGHLHLLRHAIAANPLENVIFWDLTTRRQRATLGGHGFDLLSERNLLFQKSIPGDAIFRGFVWVAEMLHV
jgi:hypothetical protein